MEISTATIAPRLGALASSFTVELTAPDRTIVGELSDPLIHVIRNTGPFPNGGFYP